MQSMQQKRRCATRVPPAPTWARATIFGRACPVGLGADAQHSIGVLLAEPAAAGVVSSRLRVCWWKSGPGERAAQRSLQLISSPVLVLQAIGKLCMVTGQVDTAH